MFTFRFVFVISTIVREANSCWMDSTWEEISLLRASWAKNMVLNASLWYFSSSRRPLINSAWCFPLDWSTSSIALSFSLSLRLKWILYVSDWISTMHIIILYMKIVLIRIFLIVYLQHHCRVYNSFLFDFIFSAHLFSSHFFSHDRLHRS